MLWEVDVYPAEGQPDLMGQQAAQSAAELGLADRLAVVAARGYLIQADLPREDIQRIAAELLTDRVVERAIVAGLDDAVLADPTALPGHPSVPSPSGRGEQSSVPSPSGRGAGGEGDPARQGQPPTDLTRSVRNTCSDLTRSVRSTGGTGRGQPLLVHVLPKPGVMDPVAQSVMSAIADFGLQVEAVRTLKKYWIAGLPPERIGALSCESAGQRRHRAGDRRPAGLSATRSRLALRLSPGHGAHPRRWTTNGCCNRASKANSTCRLTEMQTIQAYFRDLGRDPTDAELETLAQTWSEHCSHKTLTGRIRYRDGRGRAAVRQHAPRDDLRRHAEDPRRTWARTTGASASSRTTPAWSASTRATTWSSRSRRTTIPRPWSPTAGPTRASAA